MKIDKSGKHLGSLNLNFEKCHDYAMSHMKIRIFEAKGDKEKYCAALLCFANGLGEISAGVNSNRVFNLATVCFDDTDFRKM